MNIDYYNDLVKSVEQGILVLLEQSRDSDLEQDIKSVKNNREYELSLPKYGVEVFDRKLKGLMYFNILGGNNHYIDIQTNSFPETFRIRLRYKTLDTISNQTGKAFLLYKRGSEKLKGKEENIEFKIKKIR